MDISNIATRQYVDVTPDERLGQVRSTLSGDEDGVLVVEDGDAVGVVTPGDLLRSQYDDDTTVERVARAVPSVDRTADVREVSRLLVEGGSTLAPVVEGGEVWGVVTTDGILDAVTENLDVLTVSDVQTTEVVTVREDATLGEAINRLREHGVSRLPVVEEDGTLTGVLTTDDIVEFVVREGDQPNKGERVGEDQPLLDLPVYDHMSRPAETVEPDASVADAVATMLEKGYDGLVVSPEYAERVAGVLTKTDVLRALTYTEAERLDVQITNADLLETTSREAVYERIEEVVGKDEELDAYHVHVRFQRHDEEFRGTSLVRCQIRVRSDVDDVAGTGEGYGAEEALSLALEKLERNVLEAKGRRNDEEYRGQLLRKLNEL
ncbi:CBS domain-containing protein [Halomarina litorea]|uniref:CBS domain-containing protein n=1 Tax=Halomarina litorea TaxID=2961595 RepID=UPI0020C57C34|nr:CBS domain-containing protein [Halomarina sp. BCD28]